MKKILILWKYGLFLRYGKKMRYGRLSPIIGPFVGFAVFSCLIYFLLSELFPESVVVGDVDLLKVSFLMWSSVVNLMFFLTSFGSALNVLSMGKELEFLLTLPLKRVEVVLYRILSILVLSLGVFGIHFGFLIFYSNYRFGNPIFGILSFLIHFTMMTSIGMLLAVAVVRYVSSLRARQLFAFFQILGVIPFLIFSNIKDAKDFQAIVERLRDIEVIFSSPFNIFGYGISMMDRPIYSLIAILITSLSLFLVIKMSEGMTFEVKAPKGKRRKHGRYDLLKKEMSAFTSGSTTLFQLVYPYAFAVLVSWQSKDIHSSLAMVLALSSTYIARESGYLTLIDVSRWGIIRSYPIRRNALISYKIILPILLNFPLLLGVVIFYSLAFEFQWYFLILIMMTVFYQILGAVVGVKAVLKSRPSSDDPREVYRSVGFLDTLPEMILGGAGVIGLGILTVGKILIGICLLVPSMALTVVFTWYLLKKLGILLERLDEG